MCDTAHFDVELRHYNRLNNIRCNLSANSENPIERMCAESLRILCEHLNQQNKKGSLYACFAMAEILYKTFKTVINRLDSNGKILRKILCDLLLSPEAQKEHWGFSVLLLESSLQSAIDHFSSCFHYMYEGAIPRKMKHDIHRMIQIKFPTELYPEKKASHRTMKPMSDFFDIVNSKDPIEEEISFDLTFPSVRTTSRFGCCRR